VITPDDSVVIRIARSEMGQGSKTGLDQLVAEELECDWSKVSTEFPTPGENCDLNRVLNEYIILQVCKLTDPAHDIRNNDNHTIAFLLVNGRFCYDAAP
jgi:hypothetical protein